MSSVVEQISVLEREQSRLEGLLEDDRNWRALHELRALNGSGPADSLETELRLKRLLAGNPYYAARLKIVEAVTILRRLGDTGGVHDKPASDAAGANGSAAAAPLAMSLGVPLFGEVEKPSRPILLYGTEATEIAPAPSASEPAGQVEAASPPPLTAIRNITPERAADLARLGVTNVEQIANWKADDVQRVASALGLRRTISKENWIEQAALLQRQVSCRPVPMPAEAAAPEPEVSLVEALQFFGDHTPEVATAIAASPPLRQEMLERPQVAQPVDAPATMAAVPAPEPMSPKDWLAQRRRGVASASLADVTNSAAAGSPPAALDTHAAFDADRAIDTSFVPPGEAQVTITTRPPSHHSSVSVASLRSRLRPATPPSSFEINPATHAGYGEPIEEATVEIVERGEGEIGRLKSAIAAAIPDSGRVSRFLSSLKGSK